MPTTKTPTKKTPVAKVVTPKKVDAVVKPVENKSVKTVLVDTKFNNPNILISPRKLRLMANSIKTHNPLEALTRLKFTNSLSARVLVKSIQSAINDAKSNHGLQESSLRFKTIRVDEGQKIKRMDKSHGSRFNRGVIIKRHSRLEIILTGQK